LGGGTKAPPFRPCIVTVFFVTKHLADIIHDFGDKESLLWYKHVEMTMY
jgi:hypothetical protein